MTRAGLWARSGRMRYMRNATARLEARMRSVQPPPHRPPSPQPLVADPGAPDLLHDVASCSVDHGKLEHALKFAFAAGDATGAIRGALSSAGVATSTWAPDSFEADIFLDALIALCADFRTGGRPAPVDRARLKQLLARPPANPEDVTFRQAILRELHASDALQAALRESYDHIAGLVELLDEEGSDSRLDMTRFRLDVLAKAKQALDSLDAPFASARSGLGRLHAFAGPIRESKAYQDLAALLCFEGDMARVELQLRLGADGRIRALEVVQHREHKIAPYYRGPWWRMLRRVLAWFRGYRVGESELVEAWLDQVFRGVLGHLPYLVQLKGDLELYLASLHLEARAAAQGLRMCLPTLLDPDHPDTAQGKRLEGLFNPLLMAAGQAPVACDIRAPAFRHTTILTGPNSGGKTRLLQALSFAQILGQCGLFVPARAAVLRRATGLFVSLGDAASADQKEGRLGTELLRVRRVFEEAHQGSLLVLDELCSGTNPSEGEEIFQMVLELLEALEPEVYITTHFLGLARKLADEQQHPDLSFLQVSLDANERPTYQFVPGVASTSLAKRTAARLGVTREQLLELVARKGLPHAAQ